MIIICHSVVVISLICLMYRLHKLPPIRIRNYEGLERSFSFWLFEIGSCELTDDEESPAGSGECHVDLVAVGDKAQVLTTPAVGGVGLYLVVRKGTHCAQNHVVPLPTCNEDISWKKSSLCVGILYAVSWSSVSCSWEGNAQHTRSRSPSSPTLRPQ